MRSFLAIGRKRQFIGNFKKTFENFENFLQKFAKNALFLHNFQIN